MIDDISFTKLTCNVIEELIYGRIRVYPDPQLVFLSQETTLHINVSFSETFENCLVPI